MSGRRELGYETQAYTGQSWACGKKGGMDYETGHPCYPGPRNTKGGPNTTMDKAPSQRDKIAVCIVSCFLSARRGSLEIL